MKNVIIILGLFLCSCRVFKNGITKDKILGKWCSLSTQADYQLLTFRQDGYVSFDCKTDTVFGLKYTLNKNQLIITPTNKTIDKIKILKLTQDSLILETLLEYKMKQVYYRCKK